MKDQFPLLPFFFGFFVPKMHFCQFLPFPPFSAISVVSTTPFMGGVNYQLSNMDFTSTVIHTLWYVEFSLPHLNREILLLEYFRIGCWHMKLNTKIFQQQIFTAQFFFHKLQEGTRTSRPPAAFAKCLLTSVTMQSIVPP